MLRFGCLGSGSEGNGLLVEARETGRTTRVLLDCGFGVRDAERRLGRLGVDAESLDAIVVTHEHGDHVGGVERLARRHAIPVWMTYGSFVASRVGGAGPFKPALDIEVRLIEAHAAFAVGGIELRPFPVPHDAREPAQYVFSDGARSLGVLTDIGMPTTHVEAMLAECDALVLECNHDAGMLERGSYPPVLKARVGGNYGHLENGQAEALLGRIRHDRLQHVVAAHLSRQNNTPEFARAALARALGCAPGWVGVADQDEGFDWRSIA